MLFPLGIDDAYFPVVKIDLIVIIDQSHGMQGKRIRSIQDHIDVILISQNHILEELNRELGEFHKSFCLLLNICSLLFRKAFPYSSGYIHNNMGLVSAKQGLDFLGSTNRPKLSGKALKQAIDEMHARAVDALQNIRRYAQDLRPRILDDLGLIAALEWLTEDLAKNQAIDAGTEIAGKERKLPDETQLLIFRIAQEALNNVRKHARASRVTVRLEFLEDRLELTVSDNGRGFEVPKLLGDLASTGKLGLAGMRERVNLLQGKLAIKSTAGKGTTLYAVVPLP